MYTLQLTVSQGSAPVCKASPGPCLRCPPSTSGRPFGSSPSVDRTHSRPGPSTQGVLQTLPGIVRAAQRSVRLGAVRGNKQEKTNKSSEQPAVSHWLHFCRHHCLHCFQFRSCITHGSMFITSAAQSMTICDCADNPRRAELHFPVKRLSERHSK